MPVQVTIDSQPSGFKEYTLFEGKDYVIGRLPDSDVHIDHVQVSRTHARLTHASDGVWWFEDISSVGSYANGKRITRLPIKDTTDLKIGPVNCKLSSLSHNELVKKDNKNVWRKAQLKQFSSLMLKCEDSQIFISVARNYLIQTLGCSRAALVFVDDNNEIECSLGYDRWEDVAKFSGSTTMLNMCANEGKTLVINNTKQHAILSQQDSVINNKIAASLCVPVKVGSNTVAILYADNQNQKQYFTTTDVAFAESFARQLSMRLLFNDINYKLTSLESA
jgi:pSer/pThr/pTyr-binding forkhead associated (FHA) protein